MENQEGFLNDTSLLRTPGPPLTTSTVVKPSIASREKTLLKKNTIGNLEPMFSLADETSQALHEVTNRPKSKLDNSFDSSLGILHMDNFSDFTDNSMNILINTKEKRKMKTTGSKLHSQKKNAEFLKAKENQSLNPPDVSNQAVNDKEYDGEESSSSSDLEYDGTNIPELNMEYDALPSFLASKASNFSLPGNEISFGDMWSKRNKSEMSKISLPVGSFDAGSSVTKIEESRMPRDSIFENFSPAYDSIFKTSRLRNTSVSDDDKTAQLNHFFDIDPAHVESVLQNQTLAEQKFFEGLGMNSNPNASLKFCTDEISARSSSFGSPSNTPNSTSDTISLSNQKKEEMQGDTIQNPFASFEDFKDDVLRGSLFQTNNKKSLASGDTFTKCEGTKVTDSSKCIENKSLLHTSEDLTFQSKTKDLNYKNLSVFCPAGDVGNNQQIDISDSEFISSQQALALFDKDEENLKQEGRFEIINDTKESMASIWSPEAQQDITAPSWYLEMNNSLAHQGKRHISIGTLIGARTENLGRLSEDSKRERPFFGTKVQTPYRDLQNSTIISELSELDFDTSAPREKELALKSDLQHQSFQNKNETEILRASTLSRILNDASSMQPLELGEKILELCHPKDKMFNSGRNSDDKMALAIKCKSIESLCHDSKECSNTCKGINVPENTITRSSSMDSISSINETKERDTTLPNGLSASHVESSSQRSVENVANNFGNINCCLHQQKMSTRPPSSCSSSCPSQNQFGCLKYSGDPNMFASRNSLPLSSCCQYHNPHVHTVLSTQATALPIPQVFHQATQLAMQRWPSYTFPMQGAGEYFPPVQGPSELVFPENIAVGDSQQLCLTLQNYHSMHYFYHVSFISAIINGEPVSLELSGVTFPSTILRSNNSSTTDIKVLLSPKYEGKTSVTLQIMPCFNPADLTLGSFPNSALKTKLQYVASRPSISISSYGKDKLDMGAIVAGSTVVKYVTITNKCDATVPLCITLSSDVKDNHISFGLNQMKRQRYPATSEWRMISPKAMFYRLHCLKDDSVSSTLEIPIIFETGKEDSVVNFNLTVALKTATFTEPLAFLRISALVENAELLLTDSSQNSLLFRAKPNWAFKRSITVKNHASFPVIYDLIIEDDTHSFNISPTSLDMQPMQTSVITVCFLSSSTQVVKGYIQAAAQPYGKVFQLAEVIGDSKSSADSTTSRSSIGCTVVEQPSKSCKPKVSDSATVLECNKKYLYWGGVTVRSTVTKTCRIKNTSNNSVKARLSIKEKMNNFKLLDDKNEQCVTLTLLLAAKEDKCLSVVFSPIDITASSGILSIKPLTEKDSSFLVALIGYSGKGKLQVLGLTTKEGIGNCLDICMCPEMQTVHSSITVRNIGTRPMFIKVSKTFGDSADNAESLGINPTELVLLPNENKILSISYAVPQDFHQCNPTDIRAITLLYGDEIMRQQLRRNENSILHGVNFSAHFDGEERVPFNSLFPSSSKFYRCLATTVEKFLIHLNIIDTNQSPTLISFAQSALLQDTYTDVTSIHSSIVDSTALCRPTTLSVENETCEFHVTRLGQSSVAYITFRNHSIQDIKLNIMKLHPPFSANKTTITVRSKKFLKIPVMFKPEKPAKKYEETMEFNSEDGNKICIKLIGTY